jgi:N-acetylglucosaminyl-diphospho-decaprenol L-rhamnosyltransferase
MTRTSVVIVAFRSAAYLERGLPPLLADPAVGDVVVVDNSSDPATAAVAAAAGSRVQYVDPGANLGFARGCNLGARASRDPVVTFLNPDVLLERSLADLVEACCAQGDVLLGGGLGHDADDGPLGNARHRVTLAREVARATRGARSSSQAVAPGTATVPVDQIDGAFIMATRAFLDRLGGYDERFELYFEDVDLCDRARAAGRVRLDTHRYGSHAAGASSRTVAGPSYCVFRVSRIRYFAKRQGPAGAWAAVAVAVLEIVVRTLTRQPEGMRIRLRALRLSVREARRPGSVRLLGGPAPDAEDAP